MGGFAGRLHPPEVLAKSTAAGNSKISKRTHRTPLTPPVDLLL